MDVSRDTLKAVFGSDRVDDDINGVVEEIVKNPEQYRQKVREYYEKEKAENPEVCKECGGACCQRAPCHWSPKDISDLTYKALKKMLKKKKYISVYRFPSSICESCLKEVKHEGDYYYILRTRTQKTGIAAIATEMPSDDQCMLLKPDGCKISFKERPMGARLLIPEKDRKCRHLYDLDDCVSDWQYHQKVLEKLFKYFWRKEKIRRIINNSYLQM